MLTWLLVKLGIAKRWKLVKWSKDIPTEKMTLTYTIMYSNDYCHNKIRGIVKDHIEEGWTLISGELE